MIKFKNTFLNVLMLLAIFVGNTAHAQDWFVTNFAGDGTTDFVDGALALETGFSPPSAMTIDGDGNVYFIVSSLADAAASGIFKIDRITNEIIKIKGDVSGITGVAVGNDGTVYYSMGFGFGADIDVQEYIYLIKTDGTEDTLAGNGLDGFPVSGGVARDNPIGNAGGVKIDPTGEYLYYSASLGLKNFIQRIHLETGITERVAGIGGVDPVSDVVDGTNADVAELSIGIGLAWDSEGNLYFGTFDKRIKQLKTDGTIWHVAGTGVAGFNPDETIAANAAISISNSGFVITDSDELLLCDTGNSIIRRINLFPAGGDVPTISTVAGTGFTEGDGLNPDGDLTNGFYKPVLETNLEPSDMVITSTGFIITDLGKNRLRTIEVCVAPEITSVTFPGLICKGDVIEMEFEGELGGAEVWNWYKGSCTPGESALGNGKVLEVEATEENSYFIVATGGCWQEDNCVEIEIKFDCQNYYNAFTPNGDGINDFFEIPLLEDYPDNKVSLYNRWGDLLEEVINYDNSANVWYGTNGADAGNDNNVDSGTYYFTVESEGVLILSGWVEVIR